MNRPIGGKTSESDTEFEDDRPRLLGLAYRMLGTIDEAEDIVQETWIRWSAADPEPIENPAAWRTTVTTRLALDRLKSATRRRETYVGPWLPEPLVTDDGPEDAAVLADSLTLGFLTLLDRLTPVERAVVLLADVFAVPFAEVGTAVGRSEVACRQIASRARRRLRDHSTRRPTGAERRVVDALLLAFATGDVDAALERLAPDVVSISDGGPTRRAARRPVVGAKRVARLFFGLARKVPENARLDLASVNGDPGIIVYVDGAVDFVAAFEVEGEKVRTIWLVRNPDKLTHVLDPASVI